MASAWLIRRFIDPRAVFAFADRSRDTEVSFDMFAGDFSHEGDRCTFEVLVERFAIDNAVVTRIGRIVHDLDMKETRYADWRAHAEQALRSLLGRSRSVVLVGLSMGGTLVLDLASAHSDRVSQAQVIRALPYARKPRAEAVLQCARPPK